MNSNKEILNQDLSQEAKFSGVYMMWLLFREKVESPSASVLVERLKTRFGGVDIVSSSGLLSFALLEHTITYNGGQEVPSQVIITECEPVKEPLGDGIARTQFWDVPNGVELLDSCSWQIMVGDFMAGGLPAQERADILSDWLEIVMSLFPSCEAVFFQSSGKLLTGEQVRNNPYFGPRRFLWGGVNARFFNIQGTNDRLVDTLGLYALGLADVQYHFHDIDPDAVVNHAYNLAIYQFDNDAPIQNGHTVEGIDGGGWRCQYERSLIQPSRDVLDVEAGKYASGNRNEE